MDEQTRQAALKAWKKRWGFLDDVNIGDKHKLPPLPQNAPITKAQLLEDQERLKQLVEASKGKKFKASGKSVDDSVLVVGETDELHKGEAARTAALGQYDPAQGSFARTAVRRRRARLALDATATQDQASNKAYSASRRQELNKMAPDHYLTKEYGLRTAATQLSFDEQRGMRVAHDQSSVYLRDAPGKAVGTLFGEVYDKSGVDKNGGQKFDPKRMAVVNSKNTAAKLEAFFGADWISMRDTYKAEIKTDLAPGFHAIEFEKELPALQMTLLKDWLNTTGSTPSSYDALRSLNGGKPGTDSLAHPAAAESQKNAETLDRLVASGGCKALKAVPPKHPMKNVAAAASNMVAGLNEALAATRTNQGDAFDKSLFVESALKNIESLVELMPAYLDDSPRFTKLFDVMIDELYLLLATCKPYKESDFKEQAQKILADRAPSLADMKGVKASAFSMSSGMGAISSGIQAAVTCDGGSAVAVDLADRIGASKGTGSANYFELQEYLLPAAANVKDKGKVMVATLNPSTPTTKLGAKTDDAWGVDALIAKIEEKILTLGSNLTEASPLSVVIDITVEKSAEKPEDNELNRLLKQFQTHIEHGHVTFLLCKSYQKYPSLGAAKVMSGGISVVGKKGSDFNGKLSQQLAAAEAETNLMDKDEGQLMTHLLAFGGQMELPMLERAASNASFMAAQLIKPAGDGKDLYSDNLPFVVIGGAALTVESGGKKRDLTATALLRKAGLDSRDSFGFQNASYLSIGTGVRLNPGQEPESEIVEKFYAVGQLAAKKTPLKVEDVTSMAYGAANKAFDDVEKRMIENEKSAKEKSKAAKQLADWQLQKDKLLAAAGKDLDKLFKAKLQLVSMAFEPRSAPALKLGTADVAGDDANLVKAGLQWGLKGSDQHSDLLETNYLQNMVASCARIGAAVFEDAADLARITGMIDAVRAGGMERLSPEMKEVLLGERVKGLLKKGAAGTKEDLALIQQCLKEMPYAEAAARLFIQELPAAVYAGVEGKETKEMEDLTDTLLHAIAAESRLDLTATLLAESDRLAEAAREDRISAAKSRRLAQDAQQDADDAEQDALDAETRWNLEAQPLRDQMAILDARVDRLNDEADQLDAAAGRLGTGEAARSDAMKKEAAEKRADADKLNDQSSDLFSDEAVLKINHKVQDYLDEVSELKKEVKRRLDAAKVSDARADHNMSEAKDCVVRAWACVRHLERLIEAGKKGQLPADRETLASDALRGAESKHKPEPITAEKLKEMEDRLVLLRTAVSTANPSF